MASVYQRSGRPGWYIDYTDALGVNHTNVPITATTKGQADRFKAELERTIERQKYGLDPLPVTSSMTLAQLCEWWLKDVCPAAAEKKERSRLKVEVLETELGQVHLHQLDDAALERQFAVMEKRDPPAAAGTVNRLRSTLGSIFYKAHKLKKWTGTNPVPSTDPRKPAKGAYITLRPEQIALVLRVLSSWWRDLFATAFYMALRKGELFALLKTDVNLVDRELTVSKSHDSDTTKGKAAAVLPIPAPLVPYLERALKTPGPLLFPDAAGRQRLATSKPEIVLRRALARAGIITGYRHTCRRCCALGKAHQEERPDATPRRCPVEREGVACNARLWASPRPLPMKFHELRHSTATLLLRLSVPMYVVQKILRHANIKLTIDLYGHLDNADVRAAMDLMPDAEEAATAAAARKAGGIPTGALPTAPAPKKEAPDPLEELWKSGALDWSGTPGSNRRPSPWQGVARPAHLVAVDGKASQSGPDSGAALIVEEHREAPDFSGFPTRPLPRNGGQR
jgi:integrase